MANLTEKKKMRNYLTFKISSSDKPVTLTIKSTDIPSSSIFLASSSLAINTPLAQYLAQYLV